MTSIWLLSTRNRPAAAQACIDACTQAGMTSPGVVYLDACTYPKLRVPGNWTVHREKEWLSLQGSMQWCYEQYPDAACYGWLADDVRPRTQGWDKLLEGAAGNWRLSYARDLWMSEDENDRQRLERGQDLSSGLCFGGDLVRTVGWWALPGVRQAGIDTAWTELVRPLELHSYRPDVVVEHLNWRTGKRKKDPVDDWDLNGIEADIASRNQWVWSYDYRRTLKLLHETCGLIRPDQVNGALTDSERGALQARVSLSMEYALELSSLDERLSREGGIKPTAMVHLHEIEAEIRRREFA